MFQEILSRLAATLDKHELPYMIIGGQAVLLYGEPRFTRDIDVTLGVGPDKLEEILSIIDLARLRPIPKEIKTFVRETLVLPALDETTGIRVDFIFSLTPYESQAIARGNKISILETDVRFASPEDIVIHKIFAGRPRDLEDVRGIILKNPDLDKVYIEKWLREFDAVSESKDFLKTFQSIH